MSQATHRMNAIGLNYKQLHLFLYDANIMNVLLNHY